jgi:hypothetical protein
MVMLPDMISYVRTISYFLLLLCNYNNFGPSSRSLGLISRVFCFAVSAFYRSSLLTASGCFYFLLPKNRENYDKGYEYDGEIKPRLNIKLERVARNLINIPDALITEDKLADIPCEVFGTVDGMKGKSSEK